MAIYTYRRHGYTEVTRYYRKLSICTNTRYQAYISAFLNGTGNKARDLYLSLLFFFYRMASILDFLTWHIWYVEDQENTSQHREHTASLGQAWAGSTLVWLHYAYVCVSMLVCLFVCLFVCLLVCLFGPPTYHKFQTNACKYPTIECPHMPMCTVL